MASPALDPMCPGMVEAAHVLVSFSRCVCTWLGGAYKYTQLLRASKVLQESNTDMVNSTVCSGFDGAPY